MGIIRSIQLKLQGKSIDELELEHRIQNGMTVGKNCHFYSIASIDSAWPWLISFGDNVTVAANVAITAHDAGTNVVGCGTKLGRIDIGSNVFIGTGSTILCNTSIGDNVIVGAGSVVSGILPSNGVYAGVPARKICSIEEFKEKITKQKEEGPDFSKILPWNEWIHSTSAERERMKEDLKSTVGFV